MSGVRVIVHNATSTSPYNYDVRLRSALQTLKALCTRIYIRYHAYNYSIRDVTADTGSDVESTRRAPTPRGSERTREQVLENEEAEEDAAAERREAKLERVKRRLRAAPATRGRGGRFSDAGFSPRSRRRRRNAGVRCIGHATRCPRAATLAGGTGLLSLHRVSCVLARVAEVSGARGRVVVVGANTTGYYAAHVVVAPRRPRLGSGTRGFGDEKSVVAVDGCDQEGKTGSRGAPAVDV